MADPLVCSTTPPYSLPGVAAFLIAIATAATCLLKLLEPDHPSNDPPQG